MVFNVESVPTVGHRLVVDFFKHKQDVKDIDYSSSLIDLAIFNTSIKTHQEIDPKLKRNLTVDKYKNKRLLRSDLLNDSRWRLII